jgi:hypothetical protein
MVVAALLVLSVGGALLLNRATRATVPAAAPTGTFRPTAPTATPFSPHVVASPLPTGEGTVIDAPQSARAVPGIVYSVRLLATCVVLLDFDGGFYAAPRGFTVFQPIQPSTVRLLPSGQVQLHTAAGQRIELRRRSGPLTLPACP